MLSVDQTLTVHSTRHANSSSVRTLASCAERSAVKTPFVALNSTDPSASAPTDGEATRKKIVSDVSHITRE